LVIDELAIIDEKIFKEGIKPLQVVRGTVMLAMTTPKPRNFVTDMANMKNADGSPMYNVIHKTTICSECMKLPTLAERVACRHVKMPAWKSRDSQIANLEYGLKSGSLELAAQEECGLILEDSDGYVYPSSRLNEMFDLSDTNMRYYENYVPDRIYVVCDPNADGKSYTAVMSGFLAKNDKDPQGTTLLVVLGVDLIETRGSQREQLVKDHITMIRTMAFGRYMRSVIVFVPENNSGHAILMEEAVQTMSGVITFYQSGKNKPGIEKTNALTEQYCESFNIAIEANNVRWSTDLFTLSDITAAQLRAKKGIYMEKSTEIIVDEIKTQLARVRKVPIKGSDRYKISGKDGDDKQDDGAVAMWMLYYASKAVEDIRNPTYKSVREKTLVDNSHFVYNLSRTLPVSNDELLKMNSKTLNLEQIAKYH
jgi:hypothetical protein